MKSKNSSKKGIGSKPYRDHGKPYGNGKAKESKNKAPNSPEECALSFPDLSIVDKSQLPSYCQGMYFIIVVLFLIKKISSIFKTSFFSVELTMND